MHEEVIPMTSGLREEDEPVPATTNLLNNKKKRRLAVANATSFVAICSP